MFITKDYSFNENATAAEKSLLFLSNYETFSTDHTIKFVYKDSYVTMIVFEGGPEDKIDYVPCDMQFMKRVVENYIEWSKGTGDYFEDLKLAFSILPGKGFS
jgi:hypothetical protein